MKTLKRMSFVLFAVLFLAFVISFCISFGNRDLQTLFDDNAAGQTLKVIVEPEFQEAGRLSNRVYEYQAGSSKGKQILDVLHNQSYRYSPKNYVFKVLGLDPTVTITDFSSPGYSMHILISKDGISTENVLLAGTNEILLSGRLLCIGERGNQEELELMNAINEIVTED